MRAQGAALWLLASAAIAVYLVMILWSLPKLQALAGGAAPFDMRPVGYSPEEARALIDALGAEGRAFYLGAQHRLDAVYPVLMAAALALAFLRLSPGWPGRALAAGAALAAVFDYLENAAVAGLLRAGPEGFDAQAAVVASRWTVLKSASTTILLGALVALLARAGWRLWRRT